MIYGGVSYSGIPAELGFELDLKDNNEKYTFIWYQL